MTLAGPAGYDSEDDQPLEVPFVPADQLKRVVVSTDNAANINLAIEDSAMQHIRCAAHTINLSVQQFTKCVDSQLSNMRPIIKHFNRCPRLNKKLKVSFVVV